MAVWDVKDVPHKGWTCIGVEDLGDGLEAMDAESRRDYYETCQMCRQEGIRYVHIMQHPNFPDQLRVGYQCAEKMEEDYINPKKRETSLKNKCNRRGNFLKQEWMRRENGNFTMKYKGQYITIMPSKFNSGEYGVIYGGKSVWNNGTRKIVSVDEAKGIAFEMFDSNGGL